MTITKEQALFNIHSGKCNIEAWNYGEYNNEAESFADDNIELITIDDLSYNEDSELWFADSSIIDIKFTKDWTNYGGAGYVSISSHD